MGVGGWGEGVGGWVGVEWGGWVVDGQVGEVHACR